MRVWISCLLILLLADVSAQTPQEKGLAIAKEMERRDTGWKDISMRLTMILRNRQGQESQRQVRVQSLEVEGDGDKSLSIFDSPRDVKGSAFLSHTHALIPDDQWLYLPALKRVKRISSANKSGPFMGSEFAYEDLTSQEVDKYTYQWLNDEKLGERETAVIERYPTYKHSGYTRQRVWVDKDIYQAIKVEFYDRKGALLKTLVVDDFAQYANKYWRPAKMEMVNHQTGKSTLLTWSDYAFGKNLTARHFDRNTLKRLR